MYERTLSHNLNADFLSIRYEDISMNPLLAAEEIYSFIGQELPRKGDI